MLHSLTHCRTACTRLRDAFGIVFLGFLACLALSSVTNAAAPQQPTVQAVHENIAVGGKAFVETAQKAFHLCAENTRDLTPSSCVKPISSLTPPYTHAEAHIKSSAKERHYLLICKDQAGCPSSI